MSDNLKIMVVEDEEMLLQAIDKKLTNQGFDTVTCTSASQAIDYLKNMDELPDAIWLDYYLGDMNGIDFMHELRAQERYSKLPVIVVSNSASEEKKNTMLALGAKSYLLKAEYKLSDIIKIIEDFVKEDDGE